MGKEITQDEVIQHKKQAIKKLDRTFETLINSTNPKHLKKANLIAYWLEVFTTYTLDEERYDYSKIPKYERGDVISLNFGFNVGSEHGGLHYAIVLDNNNNKSSKVITVIPLSSGTEDKVYERDVYLGNELYDKLNVKINSLKEDLENRERENKEFILLLDTLEKVSVMSIIKEQINPINRGLKEQVSLSDGDTSIKNSTLENRQENSDKENKTNNSNKFVEISKETVEQIKNAIKIKIKQMEEEQKIIDKYEKELEKLKFGSIALMEQITTVSKMRIYSPKKSVDLLDGIKFSNGAMNKVNEQMKRLFIFENNC